MKLIHMIERTGAKRKQRGAVMDCTAFGKTWSEVLERSRLPLIAREHLDQCLHCTELLQELESIRTRIKVIYDREPPVDLWPFIEQQLTREGIIRKPAAEAELAPRLVRSTPLSRTEA
jgi:hypothetical protein